MLSCVGVAGAESSDGLPVEAMASGSVPLRNPFATEPVPDLTWKRLDTRALREPLVPYLRNGDFESVDSNGDLLYWDIFRDGFVDVDPALARSGVRSVRSSYLFGLAQNMMVPVSPFQTFALQGYASLELVDTRPTMRNVFYDNTGAFIDEEIVSYGRFNQQGVYKEFWLAQEVPASSARVALFLMGQSTMIWPRFDDVHLYTEQLYEPGDFTGEAWALLAGASVSSDSLTLFNGSMASQRVAAGMENQSYFLWGQYANDGLSTLTISENWLRHELGETTVTVQSTHVLASPGGTFLSDPGRVPASANRGQVQVALQNEGAVVELSGLRRGFAKVEPAVLTSGPASPDGSLKLTAALPGYLSTGTMTILKDNVVIDQATTLTLMGTTVRGEWDAGTNPSGAYMAQFNLMSSDGPDVTVQRPFEIVYEPDASADIPPLQWDTFMRGAWVFTQGDPDSTHTRMAMQLAKQDGFDMLLILCRRDQYATIRDAAALHDLDYLIFDPQISTIFTEYQERTWFSKHDYLSRLKTILTPLQGDDHFLGVYVKDEPAPSQLPLMEKMFLSLAQDGTLGVPFTTFHWGQSTTTLSQLQLPLLQIYDYPFGSTRVAGSTASLLDVVPDINSRANLARDMGLNFWHMPQGFFEPIYGSAYPVPASMYSAQIGGALLAGARGIIPFTYTSDGRMQGLRRNDLEPTAGLASFISYNQILDRIGPQLMQLDMPKLDDRAPYPFAVSTATGPGGSTYVFALNADGVTTRSLLITPSRSVTTPLQDLIAEQWLPVVNGAVQLILAPGQMALFTIGNGTVVAIDAPPVQEPVWSTVDLPVTHEFAVSLDIGSAPLAVVDLELNAAGNAVAVSTAFQYAPTRPQVYDLIGNNVVRSSGPLNYPAEVTGAEGGTVYYTASQNYGVTLYDQDAGFGAGPVMSFTGRSGGASSVLVDGDNVWAGMEYVGIRRLQNVGGELQSVEMTRTSRGGYLDLFGPFDDNSITAVLGNSGITNIKPGSINQNAHTYVPMIGLSRHGDMNADNVLAVPRHDRGVAMWQLASTGEPLDSWVIADDTIDARAVAWLTRDLLAVADRERHVCFYRITGQLATLVQTWRPSHAAQFIIKSLDSRGNRLALGFQDGTVLVADTTQVIAGSSSVYDWSLYKD